MRKNPLVKEIISLKEELKRKNLSYLPVLILDSAMYEEIKPQLEQPCDKFGMKEVVFPNGQTKLIKESTVIFVDDLEDYD